MDFKSNRNHFIKKITCKEKNKKKVIQNINISIFEYLPHDIQTYITHFLPIIDIINLPILSKTLHNDFRTNYLILPHSELYLRFNYGFLILNKKFPFLEMEKIKNCCYDSTKCSNNNCLRYKCLTDNKLLNEFLQIITIICEDLIKNEIFEEKKIILFSNILLDLCLYCEIYEYKVHICNVLIKILVQVTIFFEKHPSFLSLIFHKCLEFSFVLKDDEKLIGINGIMNLFVNLKSNLILQDKLHHEISLHMSEIYQILPIKYLRIFINFYLKL